jgi:hypothetical protein
LRRSLRAIVITSSIEVYHPLIARVRLAVVCSGSPKKKKIAKILIHLCDLHPPAAWK